MFTTTKFSTWDLPAHIQSAIDGLGWEYATEVQRDTVPLARRGRDVIGQARTGSGKTAAFGLPMIERATPCLLYTSPSPRDKRQSRMPSSA